MKPLLIFLSLFSLTRGQGTCTADNEQTSCVCSLSDGRKIDLRSVGKQDGATPAFSVQDDKQEYTYTYNPCYSFSSGPCSSVAVCQIDSSGSGRAVATQDGVTFTTDGNGNVVMDYVGGLDGRTAAVTLKCGTGSSKLSFDGEPQELEYAFTLTSQCACPGTCDKDGPSNGGNNGGGGSSKSSDPGVVGIVLLSLAFFAFMAYLITGMVIMKVKYEKTGTDIIPNKQFWLALPFLIKDGVLFTFSPCINAIKNKKGGYSNF
ncbi:uncharacterized protein [Dysidea avara]|uniref:uncharacterized protein n=1 Tax=Dysidea avara TaxID=196820 RepID=UPI00332B66A2